MNRILIATTMAASLFATNLLAADAVGPLAPGKPAGVSQAQDLSWATVAYVAAGAAVLALAASSLSQSNHVVAPPVVTTTTTT